LDTANKWLDKMAASREQWAFRWTWQHLTMGVHSTQRIEAVHSAVGGFLRTNTLLTALLTALESYSSNVASSVDTRSIRHARLNQTANKCSPHPYIDAAAKVVSPYALLLVRAQLQQASFYKVVPTERPGTFTVTRVWDEVPPAETDADDADVGLGGIGALLICTHDHARRRLLVPVPQLLRAALPPHAAPLRCAARGRARGALPHPLAPAEPRARAHPDGGAAPLPPAARCWRC
jgi:hypothetical protein